ncbi:MAG: SDR family NAD(P)-dependent oxidoreductase [Minwuia sp.]|uniref:SDR family NAD(P)-dependent oxidoreductase n=1 Tax=Minwuia sp. TaxID=2493630 RepID=UPI003A888F20
MSQEIDLSGRAAMVTGAGSGIGRRTAHVLAEAGASVACTDVNAASAQETATAIQEAGGQAISVAHDVVDEAQWAAAVKATTDAFGNLRIMVNNAGIELVKTIDQISTADFRRVMDINVLGVFLGIQACADVMHESGGGSIINLSSVAGLIGAPRQAAYCASKGAVRLMTKATALELAGSGRKVRVNSVHPGIIETPMMNDLIMGVPEDQREARIAQMHARHPIGRLGQPTDIANAILFLASDMSDFMTGSEVVVDGGMTAN